jgi:outer membrane protein assembly factor BamB
MSVVSDTSFLWVFDQGTGKLLNKTDMGFSRFYHYYAPTIYGDEIYTAGGAYFGGLSKFNDKDGRREWIGSADGAGWTPAVDEKYVYTFINGDLDARRKTDGVTAFTIFTPYSPFSGTGFALGDQMAYAPSNGKLFGFDLAKQSIAWSFDNLPRGMPALSKDTLYTLSERGTQIEARTATTGSLKWTTKLDTLGCNICSVIATNKHIFVSLDIETLAIDIDTHTVVWRHPLGGNIAISNRGVLYIVNPTSGQIAAINLQ